MNYTEYRNKLETLKAQQAVTIQNNKKFCEQLRTLVSTYQVSENQLANIHGIDLNLIPNIDVDKLTSDAQYLENLKVSLNSEIVKINDVLKEILG